MKNSVIEICSEQAVDQKKVAQVKALLPSEQEIGQLSELFKVLGDKTRLKIVLALAQEELCVCDLAWLIQLSVSAVSHQLRLLRNLKLVKRKAYDKRVYSEGYGLCGLRSPC